ncbi:unnamed protein product, partial [marine sediment metagenome]
MKTDYDDYSPKWVLTEQGRRILEHMANFYKKHPEYTPERDVSMMVLWVINDGPITTEGIVRKLKGMSKLPSQKIYDYIDRTSKAGPDPLITEYDDEFGPLEIGSEIPVQRFKDILSRESEKFEVLGLGKGALDTYPLGMHPNVHYEEEFGLVDSESSQFEKLDREKWERF